jgi:cytochrome c biogenesis protein
MLTAVYACKRLTIKECYKLAYCPDAAATAAAALPGQQFTTCWQLRTSWIDMPTATAATAAAYCQVNKFTIDKRPDGSVAQFYSDLTLRDFFGKELLTKRISVNDPFRYGGVTMYQTDWSLAALTLRLVEPGSTAVQSTAGSSAVQNTGQVLQQLQSEAQQQQQQPAGSSSRRAGLPQRSFNLPLASLEGRPGVPMGTKLYATFLPLELPPENGRPPRGISSE